MGSRRSITWLVLAALLATASVARADAEAEPPHGGRLQSVGSLIEHSTAARHVELSGSTAAKAKRDEARGAHRQAITAHESGHHTQANALLLQASKLMFEAVRIAKQDVSTLSKKKRDFSNRLASVEALSTAFERICDEKKCDTAMRDEVHRSVDARETKAKELLRDGSIDAARSWLDEAYVLLKVAIEHQRGGDTLVRSLNFASKEEEYRYELDRNDTHKMLVQLLMEGKTGSDATEGTRRFLGQAEALRVRAEQEAAEKRFEAAIDALEGSTQEYQRALRGAGIYIPG